MKENLLKIIGIIALIVTGIVTIAVLWFLKTQTDQSVQQTFQGQFSEFEQHLVHETTANMSQYLHSTYATLQTLAQNENIKEGKTNCTQELITLQELRKDNVDSMVRINKDGIISCASGKSLVGTKPTSTDIQAILNTKKPTSTVVLQEGLLKKDKSVIAFYLPIYKEKIFDGLLGVEIGMDAMQRDYFKKNAIYDNTYTIIYDDKKIIYHPNKDLQHQLLTSKKITENKELASLLAKSKRTKVTPFKISKENIGIQETLNLPTTKNWNVLTIAPLKESTKPVIALLAVLSKQFFTTLIVMAVLIIGIALVITITATTHTNNKARIEFLTMASHQLRTPVSIITWYTDMLKDELKGLTKTQKENLSIVKQNTNQIHATVSQLLNMSYLESNKLTINPEKVHLGSYLKTLLEDHEHQIQQKHLAIKIETKQSIGTRLLDKKIAQHIYGNVIDNAIKFSKEKGQVEITTYKKGNSIITEVIDNGIGIPKKDQPHIFEKFFRGNNIHKTSIAGTGLGLFITKELLHTIKGTIQVRSKEGEGTVTIITMPKEGMKKRNGTVLLS